MVCGTNKLWPMEKSLLPWWSQNTCEDVSEPDNPRGTFPVSYREMVTTKDYLHSNIFHWPLRIYKPPNKSLSLDSFHWVFNIKSKISLYFSLVNGGHRSVELNLRNPRGKEEKESKHAILESSPEQWPEGNSFMGVRGGWLKNILV